MTRATKRISFAGAAIVAALCSYMLGAVAGSCSRPTEPVLQGAQYGGTR